MAEEMTTSTTTEGAESTTQDNQTQEQAQGNNSGSAAGNTEKTFTQAEVNEMIEKRLARERKKYNNPPAAQEQGATDEEGSPAVQQVEVDVTEEARQQAAVIIAQANQRLIQAVAQSEATKLNINPDYVVDAVRLADLSTVKVNDDGTVDTQSITAALEAVLTRIPVLKATAEAQAGGFKVGGQGNNNASNGWSSNKASSGDVKRWNKNKI